MTEPGGARLDRRRSRLSHRTVGRYARRRRGARLAFAVTSSLLVHLMVGGCVLRLASAPPLLTTPEVFPAGELTDANNADGASPDRASANSPSVKTDAVAAVEKPAEGPSVKAAATTPAVTRGTPASQDKGGARAPIGIVQTNAEQSRSTPRLAARPLTVSAGAFLEGENPESDAADISQAAVAFVSAVTPAGTPTLTTEAGSGPAVMTRVGALDPVTPIGRLTQPPPPSRAAAPVAKNPTRSAPPVAPSTVPGSPTGLGLGRLVVRLEGPRARVTDRDVETISGSLVGGNAARLVLYVNGMAKEIDPDGRSFNASVDLKPGLNDLRAVATDRQGVETIDSITLYYAAPVVSDALMITSPSDRHAVAPDEPPIVLVEGRVEDPKASTVWLVANNRRTAVHAHEGRFRHALVMLDPVVRLWAQAARDGGLSLRSNTLTVHGAASGQAQPGIVVMNWPREATGIQAQVSATWRPSPQRLDHGVQTVLLKPFAASSNGTPSDTFYLPSPRPGVYTFELQYRAATSTTGVLPTLYLPEAGHLSARTLRPVSLNGSGRLVLARVLLPQGVLWEQDDWFTGQSQSGDTITKFRFPDGISWTERKVDVP